MWDPKQVSGYSEAIKVETDDDRLWTDTTRVAVSPNIFVYACCLEKCCSQEVIVRILMRHNTKLWQFIKLGMSVKVCMALMSCCSLVPDLRISANNSDYCKAWIRSGVVLIDGNFSCASERFVSRINNHVPVPKPEKWPLRHGPWQKYVHINDEINAGYCKLIEISLLQRRVQSFYFKMTIACSYWDWDRTEIAPLCCIVHITHIRSDHNWANTDICILA